MTNPTTPFGHWEACGKQYLNKLTAVLDNVPNGHWPHWNFREKEFSEANWTVEPTESLESLYQQRAKKLRKKYDWICIEYTGGSDSWYMVKAFVDAGCHVDILYHKFMDLPGQTKNDVSSKNTHAEAKYQAFPEYQKFKELDPNLEIYIHHVSDDTKKAWAETPLNLFEHNAMNISSVHKFSFTRFEMPWFIPSAGRNAMICGTDKPNLFFTDNKFYFYFSEAPVTARCNIERSQTNLPVEDILFYWDPDSINLLRKQAHIVMNWFRRNPHMLYLISNRHYRDSNTYFEIIKELVYPSYKNYWQTKKHSGIHYFTGVDDWFHEDPTALHAMAWEKSMEKSSDALFSTLKNTSFEAFMKQEKNHWVLHDQWSKLYYIGDL